MPATRERTNPKNGNDNRRGELMRAATQRFREKGLEETTLDALHAEGRLDADARIARLMILDAIHFSASRYRAGPRGRAGVDLATLGAHTTALFLREASP